ncbi:hypothetical protein D3C84_976180 [compost metagenome]
MLSRLILVIALLAGVALFIQAPAHASDRDGYYRHDRDHEVHRAPRYYEPRPIYRSRYYHPAPVYRDAPRYRHERYHHARRHDHHRRHHRDHYYRDRRW